MRVRLQSIRTLGENCLLLRLFWFNLICHNCHSKLLPPYSCMFNRKLVRTVQSAILLAALRTSFDKKMLKLVFCRHFRVLKCLTFKMRLKSFALSLAWGNSKMAYLTFYGQHWWGYRMANSRICETSRRKITRKRDFETSLSKSGKNFLRHAQIRSKGDTPLHAQRYAPKNLVSRLPS